MATVLNFRFRKADGTGSKTISIPSPVAGIASQAALIEANMAAYVEGKMPTYTQLDEVATKETTEVEILDLIAD